MMKFLSILAVTVGAVSAASATPKVAKNSPVSPSTWVTASSIIAESHPELKNWLNPNSSDWTLQADGTNECTTFYKTTCLKEQGTYVSEIESFGEQTSEVCHTLSTIVRLSLTSHVTNF